MSSKGYATPLRLEVGVNRLLRGLFLLFIVMVGAILLWLPWPTLFSLLALLFFFATAANVWFQRAELGGPYISLVWDGEQRWWWTQAGQTFPLILLGDSYFSPTMVVLSFRHREKHRRYAVVLTQVAVGGEIFRRLLVRLKLHRDETLAAGKSTAKF